MKKLIFSSVLLLFVVYLHFPAEAQMLPGMIDMTPSINTSIDNYNNMEALRRYRNGSRGSSIVAEREAIGAKIIKAGKANLLFTPTYAGTEALVKNFKFDPDKPQTVPEQVALVKQYVKRFNVLMNKAGYRTNNEADANALSYAIAYIAYYDKNPNASDIQKLRQTSSQRLLNEAYFQGMPDVDKQYNYEYWAFLSLQAIDWREKARSATSRKVSADADEKAKFYAKFLVKVE